MQAFATGTWTNLLTQWVRYLHFCLSFNLIAFPAQDTVLSWYARFLAYKFKLHSSVVNYLSGVKTLHLLLDFDISSFTGFLLKLTIKGVRKGLNYEPRQALAMNPVILHHIYQTLNLNCGDDATFWVLCLVSFFLLLHKSNVVIDSLTDFDINKLLCREDISFHNNGVWVTLRWSKTNQFGKHLNFSLPYIPGSVLCPTTALQKMWGLRPASTGPCFRRVDGAPVTYYQFQVKLRSCLKKKGYPEHLFSSHSFCRGGTTFAFLCGVPTELIKLLRGWKLEVFFRYLEFPLEARVATTELMKHCIQLLNW